MVGRREAGPALVRHGPARMPASPLHMGPSAHSRSGGAAGSALRGHSRCAEPGPAEGHPTHSSARTAQLLQGHLCPSSRGLVDCQTHMDPGLTQAFFCPKH